jgi:hypothetical protein
VNAEWEWGKPADLTLISSPKIYTEENSNQSQIDNEVTKKTKTHLRRWPMDQGLVFINAIDHQRSSATHIVDRVIGKLLHPSSLNDHIKPIRIVLLELLPLRLGLFSVQLDILVRRVELLRNVHLDALIRSDDDTRCPIQLEQLRQDQARRASAEEQHLDPNGRVELVQPMDRTRGRFQEGRFLICKIVDLVQFLLVAMIPPIRGVMTGFLTCNSCDRQHSLFDVLGEAAILRNTACVEILAQQRLSSTAIEAVLALSVGWRHRNRRLGVNALWIMEGIMKSVSAWWLC